MFARKFWKLLNNVHILLGKRNLETYIIFLSCLSVTAAFSRPLLLVYRWWRLKECHITYKKNKEKEIKTRISYTNKRKSKKMLSKCPLFWHFWFILLFVTFLIAKDNLNKTSIKIETRLLFTLKFSILFIRQGMIPNSLYHQEIKKGLRCIDGITITFLNERIEMTHSDPASFWEEGL